MKTTHTYTPEIGSLPSRVLDLFKRAPDEHFTSGDLALKYQIKAGQFKDRLQALLTHQLLAYRRDAPEEPLVWCAGERFKDWLAEQAPPPKAATKRGGTRRTLPTIDLAAIVIKTGVPKPKSGRFNRAGHSKYSALLQALERGQSAELPSQYMATLYTHVKKIKKQGLGIYTVRRTGIDTCTIWRDG